MVYQEVTTPRLADQVKSQLKQSIFDGHYSPGQRLPSENQLVETFGVSRVIVREAIRDLERSGLVEIKRGPKGGAYIKRVGHDAISAVMSDVLKMKQVPISEIMEVRVYIEPIVAALAAERATDEDIKRLEKYFEDEPDFATDEYVAWNVEFHRIVAHASHNRMYELLINILLDFAQDVVLQIRKKKATIAHDRTSHPKIFQLIRERDTKGTKQLYRKHLEDIVPVLQEMEKTPSK